MEGRRQNIVWLQEDQLPHMMLHAVLVRLPCDGVPDLSPELLLIAAR